MTPARIHLHVDIERDQEPITGTLSDAAGAALEFSGWMELMSALDTARDRARAPRPAERVPLGDLPSVLVNAADGWPVAE
jgi:hypothetical protein